MLWRDFLKDKGKLFNICFLRTTPMRMPPRLWELTLNQFILWPGKRFATWKKAFYFWLSFLWFIEIKKENYSLKDSIPTIYFFTWISHGKWKSANQKWAFSWFPISIHREILQTRPEQNSINHFTFYWNAQSILNLLKIM